MTDAGATADPTVLLHQQRTESGRIRDERSKPYLLVVSRAASPVFWIRGEGDSGGSGSAHVSRGIVVLHIELLRSPIWRCEVRGQWRGGRLFERRRALGLCSSSSDSYSSLSSRLPRGGGGIECDGVGWASQGCTDAGRLGRSKSSYSQNWLSDLQPEARKRGYPSVLLVVQEALGAPDDFHTAEAQG